MSCEGFPEPCIAPFHYANPGSSAEAASVWSLPENAHYIDRGMWEEAAGLFAGDGTIELALQGIYEGPGRIARFLAQQGELADGWLNDHVQLQIIADLTADGRQAYVRAREWNMTGVYQSHGHWSEGVYENVFVKENGVWKIQSMRYYPTFITDYDKGWTQDAQPAPAVSVELPPDRP